MARRTLHALMRTTKRGVAAVTEAATNHSDVL